MRRDPLENTGYTLIIVADRLHLHREGEAATFIDAFRRSRDTSFILLNYLFADLQTKTESIRVHICCPL